MATKSRSERRPHGRGPDARREAPVTAPTRHKTSVETLQRLAHALEVRLVVGFESGPVDRPVRELVSA
jgi:hypothetical protein